MSEQRDAAEPQVEPSCTWTYNSDGFYATSCGRAFYFDSGTLAENKFRFCFYCGRRIKPQAEEEKSK